MQKLSFVGSLHLGAVLPNAEWFGKLIGKCFHFLIKQAVITVKVAPFYWPSERLHVGFQS